MSVARSSSGVALAVALLSGCGRSALDQPIGYDLEGPHGEKPAPVAAAHEAVPEDAVARAAGALTALRLSDETELEPLALSNELLKSDAICVGEEHGSAAQHFAELQLLSELAERAPSLGLELGLGLEMWAKQKQAVLSTFGRGKMSEQEFLKESGYETSWGFPFAYYRPLLEKARAKGLPLVALNAPQELTERIAEEGLDSLDPAEKRALPSLDLDNAEHYADFKARMKRHPGVDAGNIRHYYAAQVVWDETMADTAARWLELHAPMRRLMIVAGQAHCQHSAIPERLERRGVRHVAAVWLGTARPSAEIRERYDYALIVAKPSDAAPQHPPPPSSKSRDWPGSPTPT